MERQALIECIVAHLRSHNRCKTPRLMYKPVTRETAWLRAWRTRIGGRVLQ